MTENMDSARPAERLAGKQRVLRGLTLLGQVGLCVVIVVKILYRVHPAWYPALENWENGVLAGAFLLCMAGAVGRLLVRHRFWQGALLALFSAFALWLILFP